MSQDITVKRPPSKDPIVYSHPGDERAVAFLDVIGFGALTLGANPLDPAGRYFLLVNAVDTIRRHLHEAPADTVIDTRSNPKIPENGRVLKSGGVGMAYTSDCVVLYSGSV